MRFTKSITAALMLLASISAHAQAVASANQGHHGGSNHGALGASAGAFGSSSGSANSGANGQGGSYWSPDLNSDPVDAYQPWPQREMAKFAKPTWTPYRGD
ncbi:hypothetical protein [Paraburkholderia atlantica]|uniref:hypothetical protein n=1 Tax=Paraburkholderia atlantica TaxID=2654982 RepID=UPI00161ED2D6|nr:hypothetical protein [Paraburkholderia atlantica]MBB5509544.1 hypothetical protein [Paraburkholderia atlantica]